jgi:spectinomycin phosphotransferase
MMFYHSSKGQCPVRYEPIINQAQLAEAIYEAYGVSATDLTFIPVGFAATCYRLESKSGAFFLKLWLAPGNTGTRRHRTQTLRLTRALYERNIYPRVAYPLPTSTGALMAIYADGEMALFPFLDGSSLPEVWPTALQDEWTQTLIRIHGATLALRDVLPTREQFELTFAADLQHSLMRLAQIGPDARYGLCAARDMLFARQRDIQAQLARLSALQRAVRQLPGSFVLCHTDMGSDNLLLDACGGLYVLDWDEATVAPPEHDLHEARWLTLDRVMHGYLIGGGATPLYLEHFAFYILRRALADMTARLVRLLTTNTTDEEDQDLLYGIEAWGFRQWETLDTTLAHIAATLA